MNWYETKKEEARIKHEKAIKENKPNLAHRYKQEMDNYQELSEQLEA